MFHHCHVLYPIPLTSGFARLCKNRRTKCNFFRMVGEVTQKGYKPPWQQHHDNRMPSPSALYKQLTFLEMASFWHSHGSRITRKAWLTWIETKRGYFDDMVAVSFFENFELIYWFLDVPQMTIHLNWTSQPSHHYARLKVPSFLFGDFKRHFSTNRLTLNRDRAKLLNLWGQPKFCITDWVQFSFAIWENFTQIVSCHSYPTQCCCPVMRSLTQVILAFFTAYLHKGELVRDHRAIACHYLRTWFLPDSVPRHSQWYWSRCCRVCSSYPVGFAPWSPWEVGFHTAFLHFFCRFRTRW